MTYLKHAGLVSSRKQDQWVFYYLKEEVKDIVNQIFTFLSKDHILTKDLETYEILNSNRELAEHKLKQKSWPY